MSLSGGGLRAAILRVFGAMHARGFHPAVFVGLVMMPAVVAVGVATDRTAPPTPPVPVSPVALRGTLTAWPGGAPAANSTAAAGVSRP